MISTFTAVLMTRDLLANDTYFLRFSTHEEPFSFKAGQYVILQIPTESGTARRLYSMASKAGDHVKEIELIIEMVPDGVASNYLMNMNIGDTITMQGPAGLFTLRPVNRDVVFLATGTGIAPIRSMLADVLAHHPERNVFVYWGFGNHNDIYLVEEMHNLMQQYPKLQIRWCLSRESEDKLEPYCLNGHVDDNLETKLPNTVTEYDYYLCGGPRIVDSLKASLISKEIPLDQIHFEKFTA